MCDAWGSGDTTSGAVITGWVAGRERNTVIVGRHVNRWLRCVLAEKERYFVAFPLKKYRLTFVSDET
jgi:hypothetical protein